MQRVFKYIFGIVFILMLSPEKSLATEPSSKNQQIIWKIFQLDRKSILVTDCLDIWELNWLEKKIQTWSEWIQGIELIQPDNSYFFEPGKWNKGDKISVGYAPWTMSQLRGIYQNNEEQLIHCDYLLENQLNQSRAFAREIDYFGFADVYRSLCHEIVYRKKTYDLSKASELFAQHIVLGEFILEILDEQIKKSQGLLYDARYVEFDEKYDFRNRMGELIKIGSKVF